ncbi:hypothetical protein [Pararhizobium antarcticum]|uniref:Uncharacterized protein n=1 Tax=Pararhizobium antarcticum TaxID=1798805 RepID=A0A657LTQ0_9HYPH|nr:hypothetical protein [Pararhizobium antarcticum]OJF97804.1 hypothetical protein AX761_13555 [Rhizobium sp. 58]OJF98236.1 hypothetical protein AX760_14805 [Pararhizobium antarcticum]
MTPDTSTDPTETSRGEKAAVEYSFTMRLQGLSPAEIERFVAEADGWRIKPGANVVYLFPENEPEFDGNAGDYLHGVFSRHETVLNAAAQIGTSREISLAIYFDANRIAAICPKFDNTIIRRLADLNFSLEICVFPSNFEDDEGTEE